MNRALIRVALALWMSFGTAGFIEVRAAEPSFSAVEGTWRWNFTMPDGTVTRPKLILEEEDGQLTGSTSFRPGNEAAITNVVFQGNVLRFQVIRHRNDRDIITTYSGNLSGKFLRGKIQSNWDGESRIYDWEAQRAHEGAEGVWRWLTSIRGRKVEARIKLEQTGDVLSGSVPGSGRGARRVRISNGSVKDGEVYFEIARGTGENRVVSIYSGKQSGDTIRGTIQTIAGGRKAEVPWEARRSE